MAFLTSLSEATDGDEVFEAMEALLGHGCLETTAIYTRPSGEELRRAVEKPETG